MTPKRSNKNQQQKPSHQEPSRDEAPGPSNSGLGIDYEPAPPTSLAVDRSQIDIQISTAKAWPRDVVRFVRQCKAICTMSREFAESCNFTLPRGNKLISGPSIRFSEVLASEWHNLRIASAPGVTAEDYVTAEGLFYDVENNYAYREESRRPIVDKDGRRYNADMINMTMNAARAVARRNAVLGGIPRGYWLPVYEGVIDMIGSKQGLEDRVAKALAYLNKTWNLSQDDVFRILTVKKLSEIGSVELVALIGISNALRDGETTVNQLLQTAGRAAYQSPQEKPDAPAGQEAKTKDDAKPKEEAKKNEAPPPNGKITQAELANLFSQAAPYYTPDKVQDAVRHAYAPFGFQKASDITADKYQLVLDAIIKEGKESTGSH